MENSKQHQPCNGALFTNSRKEKPSHPDFTGKVTLPNGVEHWISGWKKTGNGKNYMSLSIGKPTSAGTPPTRRLERPQGQQDPRFPSDEWSM